MSDDSAIVPLRADTYIPDRDCELGHDYDLHVIDLGVATRVAITTPLGRYNFWADSWEFTMEDGSRTLKLFGRGEGVHARTQREMELAARMHDDQREMHDRVYGLTEGQEPE